jgi:hypothetical protein
MPSTTSSSRSSSPPSSQYLNVSTSSFLSYPMHKVTSAFFRRTSRDRSSSRKALSPSPSFPDLSAYQTNTSAFSQNSLAPGVYTPARAPAMPPYTPPPLTPLTLRSPNLISPILTRQLAEEIRLLVPTRLELVDTWRLLFSLERDGSSLATLYSSLDNYRGLRGGFVLVVKDAGGNVFGAYLNEVPRPTNGHYMGTGECFLWRCTVLPTLATAMKLASSMGTLAGELGGDLAWLPPPPSEDTTHAQRMTTLGGLGTKKTHTRGLMDEGSASGTATPRSGTSTPDRIRFKAFPYSGINDYMIFCEQGMLSIGGG